MLSSQKLPRLGQEWPPKPLLGKAAEMAGQDAARRVAGCGQAVRTTQGPTGRGAQLPGIAAFQFSLSKRLGGGGSSWEPPPF